MARFTFGGEVTQLVTAPDNSLTGSLQGVVKVVPGAVLAFYTSATGGSVVTDYLLDLDNDGVFEAAASSPVVSATTGYLLDFQGPDGVQVLFYDPDPNDADVRRLRLIARDATAGAATQATTTAAGVVELATPAEAAAMTDATRAVTPAGLASVVYNPAPLQDQVTALSDDMTDLSATVNTLTLTPGPAGASPVYWGESDETVAATAGTVYRPFMALGDTQLIAPVGAMLVGGTGSGDVTVDLETATSVAGPWTSVFGAFTKPTISAGNRLGFSSGASGSVITTIPSQSLLRATVLAAPTGSGGALTWRAPASSGDGATAPVTSLVIPKPTGLAAGDLQVAVLFLPITGSPTWPSGWTAYGAPFPIGEGAAPALGPFYMHVATKVAAASEPTATVTFPSSTSIMSTVAVANGSLVAPTAANASVNTTAATSGVTPGSLTTPAAGCIVAHFAMPRWTTTNAPSAVTWDAGLATDTQAETARDSATAPNNGIAVSHVTLASAGAVPQRTASWTVQARNIMASLIFRPSSGATAKGLQVQASVRKT